MLSYRISLDLSAQLELTGIVYGKVLPRLNQAVRGIAQATASNWQTAVRNAKMWSGEKDAYANSIKIDMADGSLRAVVYTDYRYAEEIENGRPPRDLKRMLQTSMKVRVSKKGLRYLIIPFRHNVAGLKSTSINTMDGPVSAYSMAKMLTASKVIGQGRRLSGTGAWSLKTKQPATVNQNKYSWGGRLDHNDEEIPRNLKGMVRFNTSTPKSKSSNYLTFRVMSEKSRGWIIPAQPGQHIAQDVADDMRPKAESIFAEAIRRSS